MLLAISFLHDYGVRSILLNLAGVLFKAELLANYLMGLTSRFCYYYVDNLI